MIAAQAAAASRWCSRCGMRGRHADATECIRVLRDEIAMMGFRTETVSKPASPETAAQPGQECRPRKSQRFLQAVRLDGKRMRLEVAATRLGISPSALYFRIRKRTGSYYHAEEIDIRAIGADVSQKPWIKARASTMPCGE